MTRFKPWAIGPFLLAALALVVGLPGTTVAEPTKRPRPVAQAVSPAAMSAEKAFYFYVALYGIPIVREQTDAYGQYSDAVDQYAGFFDEDAYRRSMSNEFERGPYRATVRSKIETAVAALNYSEQFSITLLATLGEYSFGSRSFPLLLPKTGFEYFNLNVGLRGLEIDHFNLDNAVNADAFTWSLPMSEADGRALLERNPQRAVTVRIVYSIAPVPVPRDERSTSRYYLRASIASVDLFEGRDSSIHIGSLGSTTATSGSTAAENSTRGADFLAANARKPGVRVTTSGLQYEVLHLGNGPRPSPGQLVSVHFKGTLIDGTDIGSSDGRTPLQLRVGEAIPGFSEALLLMPVGSKFRVMIPGNLAYGPAGAGEAIGPNATLVFEIELVAILK